MQIFNTNDRKTGQTNNEVFQEVILMFNSLEKEGKIPFRNFFFENFASHIAHFQERNSIFFHCNYKRNDKIIYISKTNTDFPKRKIRPNKNVISEDEHW